MSKETNEFPEGSIQKEAKGSNKKKILFWSLLGSGVGVIIIVALLLIFLLPKEEKYDIELGSNVSIEGEVLSGNGSYKKGDSVTIVAEEITGYRFTGWNFNGKIISTDKEYTFIIGEDTEGEYTANYAKLYTITTFTENQYGSFVINKIEAIAGESVTVDYQINSENQDLHALERLYYIIAGDMQGEEYTISNNTFTMPEGNVTIYAEFNNLYNINLTTNLADQEVILEGQGIYVENQSTTIKAPNVDGYRFRNWTYNGEIISTNQEYTITKIDNTTKGTYIANYAKLYSITVKDAQNSVTIIDNKTEAIEGENVEFTISPIADYRLISVKVNDEILTESDGKYTFNMPAEDVTIIVTYAEEYSITIDSSVSDMVTSVSLDKAISGEQVVVTANIQDTVTEDYVIMSDGLYYIENGSVEKVTINQTEGQYSFTMPANDITIGVEKYRRLDDFTFDGNSITGYTGSDSELTLPAYYETVNINSQDYIVEKDSGTQITEIGNWAFLNCSSLTSVTIPEGVTSIGAVAFDSSTSLTTITLPKSLNSISSYVFSNCPLEKIVYNGSIEEWTKIDIIPGSDSSYANLFSSGAGLYIGDQLVTEITITSDVSAGVFSKYAYLEKVTLAADVNIETGAFRGSGLKEMLITENVTAISSYFGDCTNLQTVNISDNSQLQTIGNQAFSGCTKLQTVDFGDNSQLQSIGDYAFQDCTNLTSITIPASVTSIGDSAFYGCYSLALVINNSSNITITKGDSGNGRVGYYAYEVVNTGETAQGKIKEINNVQYYINDRTQEKVALFMIDRTASSVTLEEGTTAINQHAFSGCTNLTSITIPQSVTSIGESAFEDCTSLQTVDFGDNSQLQTIGELAFSDCTKLASITIPENVTSIGGAAFSDCTNLTSITIPASVTSIGNWAFYDCTNLTNIYYQGTFDQWLDISFDYPGWLNCNLYINNTLVTEISINKNINDHAFYGISSLTKVTIGEDVTSIGEDAFYNCSSLQTVDFGDNSQLQTIGDHAFQSCTNLTSITIPASVTSIGNYAFSDCTKLTSVTIESDDIYVAANEIYSSEAGYLLAYATTVKVLTTIVNTCDNSYLENSSNFTTSTDGEYTVFTKKV